MSNRQSKAARRKAHRPSEEAPPAIHLTSRLKAIALRVVLFGVVVLIIGLGLSAYRKYLDPPKPLHEFSAKERGAFVETLKSGGVPFHSVWLACPDTRPETCRLVNQFIAMFHDSGWKVEGDRVVQWTPAHPLAGVYLILQAAGEPDDLTRAAEKRLKSSFTALGIPVRSASAPDVPMNSVGVYFGPDL